MKITKTWATVHFNHGKANIELTINYSTGSIQLTHGSNDSNVTFNGKVDEIQLLKDRLLCCKKALEYAENELTK